MQAYLRTRYPRGMTFAQGDALYQRSLEQLLTKENVVNDEEEEEEEETRSFPGDLTRLHLFLEYSERTKFVTCLLAFPRFPGERFYTVVQRSFILFAIFQGAAGPSIPFNLVRKTKDKQQSFSFLDERQVRILEEVLIEPNCPEIRDFNDFLREWICADTERVALHSILCTLPESHTNVLHARQLMSTPI